MGHKRVIILVRNIVVVQWIFICRKPTVHFLIELVLHSSDFNSAQKWIYCLLSCGIVDTLNWYSPNFFFSSRRSLYVWRSLVASFLHRSEWGDCGVQHNVEWMNSYIILKSIYCDHGNKHPIVYSACPHFSIPRHQNFFRGRGVG